MTKVKFNFSNVSSGSSGGKPKYNFETVGSTKNPTKPKAVTAVHAAAPKPVPPVKVPKALEGKMCLWTVGAASQLVIPYAPREVVYTVGTRTWTTIDREGGRAPLLVNTGLGLDKINFSMFIGYRDWNRSIQPILTGLQNMSKSSVATMIQWSSWETGYWRITALVYNTTMRAENTNEITRASVDIEFTRASDVMVNVGPVSGGKATSASSATTKNSNSSSSRPKTYKVQKGDTLQKIGMKFYSNHKAWRKIATANKIKNPKAPLKVGRKLTLP